MVDHSSLLIAAYDGEAGGTKNTIDYALRRGTVKYSIYSGHTDAGPVSIGPAFVRTINYV